MKAAAIMAFGPSSGFEIHDLPIPEIGTGEILVRVSAASVNPIDWKIREGQMVARFGEEFPMVLGFDAAGVVAKIGAAVTGFSVGDEVYARSDNGPGRCYAEYVALNPAMVARKPSGLSHHEAAAMPLAALTPLYGLRDCGDIKAGDRVLLVGASGGVGTFAVQIARLLGAHVTGVCSARNLRLVSELGADAVLDYTSGDVLTAGDHYDIIYDMVGSLDPAAALSALRAGGVYITLVPVPGIEFFIPGQTVRQAGKGYFVAWTPHAEDLDRLSGWVGEGSLKPVIDSEYALDDIAAAHERSQTGRAVGKIVIRMNGERV